MRYHHLPRLLPPIQGPRQDGTGASSHPPQQKLGQMAYSGSLGICKQLTSPRGPGQALSPTNTLSSCPH